ncbi:hypothetical protein [Avibacterium paragallinarum]|nr:hypothetical protein [Avibacterium paragallinarum]
MQDFALTSLVFIFSDVPAPPWSIICWMLIHSSSIFSYLITGF